MNHKKELHSKLTQIKQTDIKFGGRFLIVISSLVIIVIIIIIQLFRLQVIYAKRYNTKALGQYVDASAKPFERGSIFFSQKDGMLISAATVMSGYKVTVNPKLIKDKDMLFAQLSPFTSLSKEAFLEKVNKKNDTYEEIIYRLDEETMQKIKNLKIQGVTLYPESWRHYPGGKLASQVLGFVGSNKDKITGQYGLERQYNTVLTSGSEIPFVNFFAEVFSNINSKEDKKDSTRVGSLITTLEPTVQSYLEKSLFDLKHTWSSERVGGVIMDPHTGEIIALANLPDFNPNEFSKEVDPDVYTNPIAESVFEIGSVVKILTMTAGLDKGVVNSETHYTDTGSVLLNTETIYNARKKSYGYVSMQDVLNKSLNTGATYVMQQLGKDVFKNYFYSFGLKEKTGIDLPNEISNLVKNLESPRELEYATASFGQGIALTPISAVRAFALVSNGGYLVTPHIVKKIIYDDGTEKVLSYKKSEPILKADTSNRISQMLKKVVDEALLGGEVKLKNHTAAAKTGTAQIASLGGYREDAYLHTMIAYFPAYNPKYIVFLYNMKPHADDFAAKTVGPTMMDIGQFLMTYYNVPSDRKL